MPMRPRGFAVSEKAMTSTSDSSPVVTGLERLIESSAHEVRPQRCGLLMNQASVARDLRSAAHCLAEWLPAGGLVKLFTPQHGMWGTQQANMCETAHGFHRQLQIPICSLYSETRRPTAEMLHDLDYLIIDLQDVGTRVYTFVGTIIHCLQACAEARVAVHVLDRPNPLGGKIVEGPCLDPSYTSFVGMLPIPMRHGLTLGELARLGNEWLNLGADLHVEPMSGWRREMLFPDTGLPWVPPSPNMPRFETALVYPGQVLLEGTNVSEGRGTTQPFELCGAPFIDPARLRESWTEAGDCGLVVRETYFQPTFDKWRGQVCGGLAWHWQDPRDVRSYAATVTMLSTICQAWPDEFAWSSPPYEYEWVKPPIDILSGSDRLRCTLADATSTVSQRLHELWSVDAADWWHRVAKTLLYD
jgi:uncharacterized protein YbbC (DUF1343 family)